MYRVRFQPGARKELDALPQAHGDRVTVAIKRLAEEPRPPGSVKIAGARPALYRIRVGRYRVVYEIRDDVLLILIVLVAKRDERTYRRL